MTYERRTGYPPIEIGGWNNRKGKLYESCKPYYTSPSHDEGHVVRSLELARFLQEIHGGNINLIEASLITHDLGRHDDTLSGNDSVRESVKLAREILIKSEYTLEETQAVCQIVSEHDDSTGPEPSSIESQIVADADMLDGIGSMGVIRATLWTGESGGTFDDAVKRITQGMRERIDILHFHESRTLGRERYNTVIQFLRGLENQRAHPIHQGRREPGTTPKLIEKTEKMEILSVNNFTELQRRLREDVGSLGDRMIYPYTSSNISLLALAPQEIQPSSTYLLENNIRNLERLRELFLKHSGVDILKTSEEAALIQYQLGGLPNVIYPPIIEKSEEDGGINIITDGGHRVLLAKQLGLSRINVIYIKNASTPHPSLPTNWEDIDILEEVPQDKQKRIPRFASYWDTHNWIEDNRSRVNNAIRPTPPPHYRFFRNLRALSIS